MLGLCCDKTYSAMTKYDNGDDNIDIDRNKDRNDEKNAASGSLYNGPIFDQIKMNKSRGWGQGDNINGAAVTVNYVSTRRTIYLTYKDTIKGVT